MKKIIIPLVFLISISATSFAQSLSVQNITKFFNTLSVKQNGWNGHELIVANDESGKLKVVRSQGGYEFDKDDIPGWVYGFGMCTLDEESMCKEGFGGYRIQNGQLFLVFDDEEIKLKVLSSTPSGITYQFSEKTNEGNWLYSVQLKITKAGKFIFNESASLNGEHKRTSKFQGH